jgi:thiamine pyrophosphate-dependent acetolactate synthase large subunit-like protein
MKSKVKSKYGSDLIVDLLKNLNLDYIAFNPGVSFRGLHESLVNYGGNEKPEIICCLHENIAVSLAQGYAKVAMKPMAVAIHNLVGLLNGSQSIFIDFADQTPVLILGGGGPMAVEHRDPEDWHHIALIQGNAVRDFVKWDDQPASIESIAGSIYRAYGLANSEPKGPVYVCLDAGLQEKAIDSDFPVPDYTEYAVPSSPQADHTALKETAELLVNAKQPVIMADYMGRNPEAVSSLIELAEFLAAAVIDAGSRFNFPNTHPLDVTGLKSEFLKEADVILGLDMHNFYSALTKFDLSTGKRNNLYPENTKIIHIGLNEYYLRSWSPHTGDLQRTQLAIMGETSLALPSLLAICKQKMAEQSPGDREKRYAIIAEKHKRFRKECRQAISKANDEKSISLPLLASELWEVVKKENWVLVNRHMKGWARRLWDWDSPHQWIGAQGGGTVGYGVAHSLGAALAHKGSGRLCIDLQPDGDFLYTPNALWTAAHHRIPLLIVMLNNRRYNTTYEIQEQLSQQRVRSTATAGIATKLDDPPIDFAALARSFGLYAEGPVASPDEIRPALERAVRYVKEHACCALVDIVTN